MSFVPAGGAVLPVDKPRGPTSHDVVALVRKALDIRRVGHTGTLDPFASGLLLVCVGPATRLSEYLSGLDKTYRATVRLGVRTTTHDPEGDVVEERGGWEGLDRSRIEEALASLTGTVRQRPPAFSAKKVGGEPAHRKARRGEAVELEPADVRVDELTLVEVRLPELELHVRCSSGTYVRALARDLGEALGTGAHLTELRRTAVGRFSVKRAVPLDELTPESAREAWMAPARALAHLPRLEVDADQTARLATGQFLPVSGDLPAGPIAVLHDDALVAVATAAEGRVRPRKVFV